MEQKISDDVLIQKFAFLMGLMGRKIGRGEGEVFIEYQMPGGWAIKEGMKNGASRNLLITEHVSSDELDAAIEALSKFILISNG